MTDLPGRVRLGVIGAGWWATQFHLPSLTSYPVADVVALADPDRSRLDAAAERFGVPHTFGDHRDLLGSGGVDGVVIAVPHDRHYEVARAALDAGVHVMLEKPMALRGADAWDLVDRAQAAGLHLVVGYNYQFTATARRAQAFVRSGRLGRLLLVSGTFSSMVEAFLRGRPEEYADEIGYPVTGPQPSTYSDPTRGGGQAHSQVTHAMGMVFWVTGRRPREVYARMAHGGLSVDLVDAITYELDDGCIGTMASTGTLQPGQPSQRELRYYGTEGYLTQDLVTGRLELVLNDGTHEIVPELAAEDRYPFDAPGRCLVDLLRGAGENPGPPNPAAATVEFLEAAHRSAASRLPVRLDTAEADPGGVDPPPIQEQRPT